MNKTNMKRSQQKIVIDTQWGPLPAYYRQVTDIQDCGDYWEGKAFILGTPYNLVLVSIVGKKDTWYTTVDS